MGGRVSLSSCRPPRSFLPGRFG